MPGKHVILTLNYEGETKESQAAIVIETKAIKSKLERKGHTATLHTEQLAFQEWMTESTESKGDLCDRWWIGRCGAILAVRVGARPGFNARTLDAGGTSPVGRRGVRPGAGSARCRAGADVRRCGPARDSAPAAIRSCA